MDMKRVWVCTVFLMILVTGCNKDNAKAPSGDAKWLGTYKNSKEGSTLVLGADHKGTLDAAGQKGDITWEIAGDDKIVVHAGIPIEMFRTSDGNLRDQESTDWKKS
jgi:hypothetical protein